MEVEVGDRLKKCILVVSLALIIYAAIQRINFDILQNIVIILLVLIFYAGMKEVMRD